MLRGSVIARNLIVKGMAYSTATSKVAVRGAVEDIGQRLLKHCDQRTSKTTETKTMSGMHVVERDPPQPIVPIVPSCGIPRHASPRVRIVPVCEPPPELIAAMVDAGGQKEELDGEDLRIMRIENVRSKAWEVYKDWACSLGEVDPMVQAVFAPTVDIETSASSPPAALAHRIQREANSIINHMAPLLVADFPVGGIPSLPGPLQAPTMMTNVHHAKVAVTALLETISNPGANYQVINGLRPGVYICHVQYGWRGAFITVCMYLFFDCDRHLWRDLKMKDVSQLCIFRIVYSQYIALISLSRITRMSCSVVERHFPVGFCDPPRPPRIFQPDCTRSFLSLRNEQTNGLFI